MKNIIIISFILVLELLSSDFVSPYSSNYNNNFKVDSTYKLKILKPVSENNIKTLESLELKEIMDIKRAKIKAEKEKLITEKKEKISNNFTTKETLQEVEKVKTEVKANGADADFFNSLDDGDSKPIDME